MTAKAPAGETGSKSEYATAWRTRTCGELRKGHEGEAVTLCGQVEGSRVEERTIVLRDHFGKTLVHVAEGCAGADPEMLEEAGTPETILQVKGTVEARGDPDKGLPTGEVVVEARELVVVNVAESPLIYDFNDERLPKTERIRHRYLYLRKPRVHDNFAFRSKLAAALRRLLDKQGFREVETPVLSQAWTPEQEEAFFAVRGRKEIFALPGKREPHGELLMAGGFDRTFELARRFQRKEKYGPYQQPEFTVLELMMAFVEVEDLLGTLDQVLAEAWKTAGLGQLQATRLTFEAARAKYGSDCPDLRFELAWQDMTDFVATRTKMPEPLELISAGGAVRTLVLRGGVEKLTEQARKELARLVAERGASLCAFLLGRDGLVSHHIAASEVSSRSPFEPELSRKLCHRSDGRQGDVVLCILARTPEIAGPVRLLAARLLGALPEAPGEGEQAPDPKALKHSLVVVTRLPYFRWDGEKWRICGDPLTRPVERELEGDPHRMHGHGFHVVLDGVNVGGGAVRNHDPNTQQKVFEALGFGAVEADRRWGNLLRALRFGTPPHGRIAIGYDRLVALLLGIPSIDELIALPKLPDGSDPQALSPWPVDAGVVRGWFGM